MLGPVARWWVASTRTPSSPNRTMREWEAGARWQATLLLTPVWTETSTSKTRGTVLITAKSLALGMNIDLSPAAMASHHFLRNGRCWRNQYLLRHPQTPISTLTPVEDLSIPTKKTQASWTRITWQILSSRILRGEGRWPCSRRSQGMSRNLNQIRLSQATRQSSRRKWRVAAPR